jgi:hypothetical protein
MYLAPRAGSDLRMTDANLLPWDRFIGLVGGAACTRAAGCVNTGACAGGNHHCLVRLARPSRAEPIHEGGTQRFVTHVGRKRGMATALKQAVADAESPEAAQTHADMIALSKERMRRAITTLVEAGVAAGTVRSDVEPMDLLRSIRSADPDPDPDPGAEQSVRVVSLLTDGMRYGAGQSDR